MALGDSIKEFSQFGKSSYIAESQMISELNQLRRHYENDNYKYKKELLLKSRNDELDILKKLNDKKMSQLEAYNKKVLKAQKKLQGEDLKAFEDNLKKKQKKELEAYEKYLKTREEAEKRLEAKSKTKESLFSGRTDIRDKFKSAKSLVSDQGFGALADVLISGIADISKYLDKTIDSIGEYQGRINTRLYGSGLTWENGLPWESGLSNRLAGVVGISPFIQTKKLYDNVDKLVNKGISYNIEQRAFLETIAGKIATTFHVDNQSLLNLIRVQQADTTAARLGLEANLNKYFNGMYQSTEYLTDSFDTVSSSIYEALSQMSAEAGVGVEYQIQKWLGSLYSVGMSSSSISGLAGALGQIGSGNLSNVSTGLGRLLIMAGGKNYTSILKGGLTAENTNLLLASMVQYLAEIAESTKENLVVRSKYAEVFGLSVSDLTAIANLAPSLKDIYGSSLDYASAMNELTTQAGLIGARTSIGEMMSNMWENVQYNMASGIAANPALFAIWKVANALDSIAGGIALPDIKVMGSGVNLQTTVADIMRVGALSGGLLGGIGTIIASGAGGGFSAPAMLNALGLTGAKVSTVTRGSGLGSTTSGFTTSASTFVGNTSGSDVYESTMAGVEEQKTQMMAEAKEESEDVTNKDLDNHIVDIYDLLSSIIEGGAMNVKVADYGLTNGLN